MDRETTGAAEPGRPWTLEAAMEPLRPLAPPAAPPGDRRGVDIATARRRQPGSPAVVWVGVFLVLLTIAVAVLLVLILGR